MPMQRKPERWGRNDTSGPNADDLLGIASVIFTIVVALLLMFQ